MNQKSIIGIILIVLGIIAFTYQSKSYTTHEKTIDIGSLRIIEEKTHNFRLPPYIGMITLATGSLLFFTNKITT